MHQKLEFLTVPWYFFDIMQFATSLQTKNGYCPTRSVAVSLPHSFLSMPGDLFASCHAPQLAGVSSAARILAGLEQSYLKLKALVITDDCLAGG
jgi:hypothetical protein